MSNPVGQLGFEISRKPDASELNLDEAAATRQKFGRDGFRRQAKHLNSLLAPADMAANEQRLRKLLKDADNADYKAWPVVGPAPLLACVFAAYPTFLTD